MECNNPFNSYCNHMIMILYYPAVDTQSRCIVCPPVCPPKRYYQNLASVDTVWGQNGTHGYENQGPEAQGEALPAHGRTRPKRGSPSQRSGGLALPLPPPRQARKGSSGALPRPEP